MGYVVHPERLPTVDEFEVPEGTAASYVDLVRQAQRDPEGMAPRQLPLAGEFTGYAFDPYLPAPILAGPDAETRDDIILGGHLVLMPETRLEYAAQYSVPIAEEVEALAAQMALRLTFIGLQRYRSEAGWSPLLRGWRSAPEVPVHISRPHQTE